MSELSLKLLSSEFCVCQIDSMVTLQSQGFPNGFYTITRSEDEISLVCESSFKIETIKREDGWRVFKIDQILQFEQIGVIARISEILKNAEISIFVISTFNTDYLMVKQASLSKTKQALSKQGYSIK